MVEIPFDLFAATDDSRSSASADEPITTGMPLPAGLVTDPERVVLTDRTGAPVASQRRVLERWRDGSIRWLLVDFRAPRAAVRYHLTCGGRWPQPQPSSSVTVTRRNDAVVVGTGAAEYTIAKGGPLPFASVVVDGTPVLDGLRTGLWLTDADGDPCEGVCDRIDIDEAGPLRTVVRVRGMLGCTHLRPLLLFDARLSFYAGASAVRCALTVRNPRRARHAGGLWDLGDPGSVLIRDLSLIVSTRATDHGSLVVSTERDRPCVLSRGGVHVYQESSGGANWQSRNHVNRDGVVPWRIQGYRCALDQATESGLRATPLVVGRSGGCGFAFGMEHFWENFPKSMTATPSGIAINLFPYDSPDLHEIQGGEQKTHDFVIAVGDATVSEGAVAWALAPRLGRAQPEWYARCEAVPYLTPAADDGIEGYDSLVNAAIDDERGFVRRRDIIDEYGWRNFGELYADHEAVGAAGDHPLVSHYNNQYDAIAGFAVQFMRTGDRRWWRQMAELAAHVIDIDIYHTDEDRAAYNHGMFWHTSHSTDAAAATHRSYPSTAKPESGGPSPQHNYTSGLMLHYLLTGNPQSREAVLELARFVLDLDDAWKTPFWWVAPGETAMASHSPDTRVPGRAAANSIGALLDGHRVSGDPRFLAKAERIIRRSVHPADDLEAMDLLNAEDTWFYTMFLEALGRYLDYKVGLDALDRTYAYARDSLLHYARWMADHEFPFLDRAERLERPTETWAAQDIRKHEIFLFAAKHADGSERQRFLECADRFFDYVIRTLNARATRTLTRPVVIMLTHGFRHTYRRRHPECAAPPPRVAAADFGEPERVVCLKERVKRRAMIAGTTAAAMALLFGLMTWR